MTTRELISDPDHVDPGQWAMERAALEAVLTSATFEHKPRLANLLKYICEKHFHGQTNVIKEYSIATDVLGRPDSFDQATDSIVRVEVFRLRKKLREFYASEGATQPVEIVVPTGHYRPEFVARITLVPAGTLPRGSDPPRGPTKLEPQIVSRNSSWPGEKEQAGPQHRVPTEEISQDLPDSPRLRIPSWNQRRLLAAVAILAVVFGAAIVWRISLRARAAGVDQVLAPAAPMPALPIGPEIRIRCGYSRPIFKDEEGNVWNGDRYFSGGSVTELPNQQIGRTRSPELYLTARTGVFSYKIPLPPGVYELRLHFAETTYSPASSLGGGENSRVFDVQINGGPLLQQFDIVSDAGANTADVRVFRDISPSEDGYLHLDFSGSLGLPMINAIEILPGLPHRLRPIRMVARNSFFVDAAGNLWMPDTYYSGGRLASDKVAIADTEEPELYLGERYGNFNYALPVDKGTYKLTLYFSEKYWGSGASGRGGAGSRVFDVLCNGLALTRNLDIVQAAGSGRALVRTYRGLRPNAQGKLVVSFIPDVNYASVDALELEDETP